jgi:competence protein ComGC
MEVKKMAKTKKVLLITVILSVLFISSAYAVLTPNARAAEINIQQKGLDMTKNVVGLDLSKYTVTQKEDTTDQQATYLGLIPQENVKYNLVSDSGELTVLYTFAEGKLQMIQVLDNFGKPITNKLPNVAPKMAYDFLSDYEAYTANPLYGELKSTLNNVDAGKNLTKTEGNTVLEITTIDDYTNFKWYYTANGAIAPYSKFISLSFKNGFLSAFVDNYTTSATQT